MPHFKGEALLPVFEAVVNSIQAIEERDNLDFGEIEVRIVRDPQQSFDNMHLAAIRDFVVIDNGVGFNGRNYDSFQTSDSIHKQAIGGKGVGRFLWLKAFDKVEVDSIYESEGKRLQRKFSFTTKNGIEESLPIETTREQQTLVRLCGFKDEYRKLQSAYKTTAKIAQRILEHCLSYFISGVAPRIVISDDDEHFVLNEIFDREIRNHIVEETITLEQHVFSLAHLKLYATYEKMHNAVLCANRREVKSLSLTKELATTTQFDETDKKFTYALYVSSPYLDQTADVYRLDFEIPEEAPLLNEAGIVSMNQIKSASTQAAKNHLQDFLKRARLKKEEVVSKYITENPALRAVPTYCPEVFDEIEPNSTVEKINEVLYRHKGKAEFEIRKKSNDLLKTQGKSLAEVEESYQALQSQLNDFQKDNLASYLCDRKRIIDLLAKKLELNSDGKFANEDIIHDIIFPRKTTTDQIGFENHNLWLIDECLTFHAFAASDKPLKQTTSSESAERPDILAFAEVGEDKIARAVSLLEFKKPQRTSFDEDPTKQVYRYLREIRNAKKVQLPNGRSLMVSEETRYYCFVICDLTTAIEEFVENNSYAKLMGEFGYYTYNRNHNAHTEVLGFDKIVLDAERRHKAFFEKLGI